MAGGVLQKVAHSVLAQEKWHNRGWDATENWANSDLEHIQTETVWFYAYIQLFLAALGVIKCALLLLSKTLI